MNSTYIERGKPVRILASWSGAGPRNVRIKRVDDTVVVRPFRGLRRFVRCDNCTRERLASDVFWHATAEKVYCRDVFACEQRLHVLSERFYNGAEQPPAGRTTPHLSELPRERESGGSAKASPEAPLIDSSERYGTIVVDPPWPYRRKSNPNYGAGANPRWKNNSTPLPYPEMSLEEIGQLPVTDLASADAHLYLWTTQRHLETALEISQRWGFKRSALLVWCKAPRGWHPAGTFMSTTEFVVFARRGSAHAKSRCNRQWWDWPRSDHSAKPEAFLDIVESVSPGPYLELFARRARFGWDYWGDQSLGTAALDTGAEGPLALERTE